MAVVNEARQGGGAAGLRRTRRREMGGGGGGDCSVLVREGQIFVENFWR